MAHYKVQTDKGLVEFDSPYADLTKDEVENIINQNTSKDSSSPVQINQEQSTWSKIKDVANFPMKKAEEGLGMIQKATEKIPQKITGNIPLDVAINTPGIIAQSATKSLQKVAPGFVSPLALAGYATAPVIGAAGSKLAPAGKAIANQLEQVSGIAPKAEGALSAAAQDATLMLAKGKKAASPIYNAAKSETTTNLFKGMYKPEQILDTAQEHLSEGGKLLPREALTVRKAIDSLMKSPKYIKDELIALRTQFDKLAKTSENISEADKLYARGRMAEALRNILPQNKYGGASPFKMMMAGLAKGPIGLAADATLFSPAVQGLGATAAGIAGRTVSNKQSMIGLAALLQALKNKK